MATIWDISSFHDLTNINSGYQFADGDIIQAEHINDALENTGWLKEKVEEIETNIASNYKLYNHSVCVNLILNASSVSDRKQYWVNLYLQDNSNVSYNNSRLMTELTRIRNDRGGYSAYVTHCSYSYADLSTPANSHLGIGVLMVYSNKVILRSTTGTVLFDSTNTDTNYGTTDVVTLARQNS